MNGATVKVYSLAKDGNKQLSTNFRVREFACKDGSDVIFISDKLWRLAQAIRSHFGQPTYINSAYRTPVYNKKVGGSAYSQHLYGKAMDIVVEGVPPSMVADYAETLMPNTGGIGRYKDFTHIDDRTVKSRWNG